MVAAAVAIVLAIFAAAQARDAKAVLPPGSTVSQWDKIAEDTVVGSGAFQNESFIYMAYTTQAMYEANFAGGRRVSRRCAVIGAASTALMNYFPSQATIGALRQEALGALPDNQATKVGLRYGDLTAEKLIAAREGDGLQTPIASTSTFPKLTPAQGCGGSRQLPSRRRKRRGLGMSGRSSLNRRTSSSHRRRHRCRAAHG
jgi:hypothetical protein